MLSFRQSILSARFVLIYHRKLLRI
jgi:hypothetical protein